MHFCSKIGIIRWNESRSNKIVIRYSRQRQGIFWLICEGEIPSYLENG